jgi:hypothetical protein
MTDSPNSQGERRPLPGVFYNPITMLGTALAALSLGLIGFLVVLEALAEQHKPYMGIIAFVILPVFLIIGLLLIAVGAIRESRRKRRGLSPSRQLPRINLNNPAHRRAFVIISGGGLLFLMLSAFGSYKAYEYTDSDEFCGTVCHTVMKPEYTAYNQSPHARVNCVDCHIGPGATWFVRSKLSGTYQVYSVLFDKYPRPIHTPIKSLRPSADTCEQCHWPAYFYAENLVGHDYYLTDEDNTHMHLNLVMKIGGGNPKSGYTSGIHWHMNIENDVSYVATDERRQEIPWVKSKHPDGTETIYRSTEIDFDDSELASHEIRRMDCIDCHNRPTHNYNPPNKRVNDLLTQGRIARDLPYIKSAAVDALEGEYATTDEAMSSIEAAIRGHFEDDYPEIAESRESDIATAIAELQDVYRHNYFPEMGVSWAAFPDNIGHLYAPGCFRCHDGNHVTEDGRTLTRSCNVCHTLLSQETGDSGETVALHGVEYQHPEDIGGAWKEMNCSECHGP